MYLVLLLLSLLATCAAMWSMRASANLDRCVLQEADYGCWRDCWQDPCCLAVNVISCEKSYVHTEALHFVKEGAPVEAVEDCSCSVHTGGYGGWYFTHPYTGNAITKIIATSSGNGLLSNVGVEYADGTKTDHDSWSNTQTCSFDIEERIITVNVFTGSLPARGTGEVVYGIEIMSTVKSCGLFGTTDSATKMYIASGHRLLFMKGKNGACIDGLTWTFDYGCNVVEEAPSGLTAG